MLRRLRRNGISASGIASIFSRNFGKEAAMKAAGLDHARGDAVIIIDADLQDPPELIRRTGRAMAAGYDVVYAQRVAREGETPAKRLTAYWFYRIIQRMNRVRIPVDTGDFRLLSRRAVDSLKTGCAKRTAS